MKGRINHPIQKYLVTFSTHMDPRYQDEIAHTSAHLIFISSFLFLLKKIKSEKNIRKKKLRVKVLPLI